MGFLHSYVDLIIGVDDRAQSIKSSFYLHYHKETDLDDYDKMLNRMLMFEKSPMLSRITGEFIFRRCQIINL